jgi:hypothetical protein
MMNIHNRTPLILCLGGGTMLIVSGASGAIGVLEEIKDAVSALFGLELLVSFESVMGALALLTVLAGIVVIVGGLILTSTKVHVGRLVILLAVSAGVAGLLMTLLQAAWAGRLVLGMTQQLQQSLGWIGAMLGVVARTIAEQKPLVDR